MLKTRIIPCLLLRNGSLVKTVQFNKFTYIGDPANTVRIFNEIEVDELSILDITATTENREPDLKLLRELADECFMPLSYGGGIRNWENVTTIFKAGYEKVIINSALHSDPSFITRIADHYGSQAVIVSIDFKRNFWGKYEVYSHAGSKNTHKYPVELAQQAEKLGAGELLITSIDKEGTWSGFDLNMVKAVTEAVQIPVIAHGGAGSIQHIEAAVKDGGASAVALGSMVTFQKKGFGVLINFPDRVQLEKSLEHSGLNV